MKRGILICMGIWTAFIACAQDLTIEIERDTINVESKFSVKYSVNESCNARDLKFDNFIVVAGPSISRSISIVNGKRSAETTASYILTPMQEGTFELPSQMCDAKMNKPVKIVALKNYESKEDTDKRIREKRKIKKI